MKTCGKAEKMLITKYKTTLAERKDIENALATNDKRDAIIDYIVACDYPEVFEDDEEDFEA